MSWLSIDIRNVSLTKLNSSYCYCSISGYLLTLFDLQRVLKIELALSDISFCAFFFSPTSMNRNKGKSRF